MAQTTRTFRIFVSSTFSDMKEERNALQREVFPLLRELCLRHGCRFQAVDLRWGVREEAALDQQTMKICLDEIRRSQRASPRPNFIVLLGDRYGWRPPPSEIPSDEFEEIVSRIDESEKQLLTHWYRRDDNALPAVYSLQPRRGEFADFSVWEERVERPLRSLLLKATREIEEKERIKYEASATEQEIIAGALGVPDAQHHVFCFFRRIANLDDLVNDLPRSAVAGGFIDRDENGQPDGEAQARLGSLKDRLRRLLPRNTFDYEARWNGDGISSDNINRLCEDVFRALSQVVKDEIARIESIDSIDREINDHIAFGEDRAKFFTGRAAALEAIQNYLSDESVRPLVIAGESGSGKSALLARAVEQSRARYGEQIITRFIGATPASSDGRALIESLCRQISRIYEADEADIPSEYKELTQELLKRLALASKEKPFVIFLDALDQLSDANHSRNLAWLPSPLPRNVRLIVSTLEGECLSVLERKLSPNDIIRLEPMQRDEGHELLDLWLASAGRALQPVQREEVLSKFESNGLPLYLKLAFEEARRWKSFDPSVVLSRDTAGIIRDLFRRLSSDAAHGEMIVSRSLGYLAAAKNGLTEDEMLDVLSQDESAFNDFELRSHHTPPERRLPVVVWSRLYFDLEPYLSERDADGARLMTFYHRQLREVVERDYLSGDEKPERHALLADYFAGQRLFDEQSNAPNLRKLAELPFQQTMGEKWEELYATLTDFEFLEAKCAHVAVVTTGRGEEARKIYSGVYELQEDYRLALEKFPAQ